MPEGERYCEAYEGQMRRWRGLEQVTNYPVKFVNREYGWLDENYVICDEKDEVPQTTTVSA